METIIYMTSIVLTICFFGLAVFRIWDSCTLASCLWRTTVYLIGGALLLKFLMTIASVLCWGTVILLGILLLGLFF